ncbi:MAG TPA: FixH family protein [Chryseolinea sp.]
MNWGKWIIVSFVLFAAFIGTLVTVCVRQDINLVSKDYYQEELQYESQLSRLKNVSLLQSKPVIKVLDNGFIQISFEDLADIDTGELKLFRPSDPTKDRKYNLAGNSNDTAEFPTDNLSPGMYRAKMQWTMNGKEFYVEEVIFI